LPSENKRIRDPKYFKAAQRIRTAAAFELDLEALEVSLALDNTKESLQKESDRGNRCKRGQRLPSWAMELKDKKQSDILGDMCRFEEGNEETRKTTPEKIS